VKRCKLSELRVVSLFSGIGGFEEGLNLSELPFKVVFASEIDKFAQQSYGANFDSSVMVGDITKISETEIPDHDLLVGGFPCQAFSIAGQRKGFEDTRGTLFFDVLRILREKKPKYFLLENVKNLISHDKGTTFEVILSSLKDLGYVIDFTVLNSKDFGVPQSRERTFICGILGGEQESFESDKWSSKVDKLKQNLNKVKLSELGQPQFPSFNVFNSLNVVDKDVVLEDILGTSIEEPYYQITKPSDVHYLKEFDFGLTLPRSNYILRIGMLPREIHKNLEQHRRFHSFRGLAPTITARHESPRILVSDDLGLRVRKLTETECFLAQGYPLEFVKNIQDCGTSRNQMYKQAGNSVSPPVIAAILKELLK
jgi:modification methylase rho11sI